MKKQKAQLEQNIQIALQSGGIDLEDAIDLRQINNLKLANQSLKVQKKEKARKRSSKSASKHSGSSTSKCTISGANRNVRSSKATSISANRNTN
jgi:hypothetical protein